MKNNLYIFATIALLFLLGCNSKNGQRLNENASINEWGNLPENPLLLNAITTSIHPKDSLMTVLYGNESAYDYAHRGGIGNYPESSVLYSVTWQLQEDMQWFGANIPKNIKKIERVEFFDNNKTEYSSFDDNGIKQINSGEAPASIARIKHMKIAVSP